MPLSFAAVATKNLFRENAAMRRCLMTMCFAALAVSATLAQEKKTVPPPPKPADEGRSLEVTMEFIQEKLGAIGPVNYRLHYHDNVSGNDGMSHWKIGVTKVVADSSACRVSDHFRQEFQEGNFGAVLADGDFGFSLKEVANIVVMQIEQLHKEWNAAAGHTSLTYKVDPPIFLLRVHRADTKEANDFPFFDEDLANRVAKAMVHAVELCGGGSKPEPF
jgi:hypothetical protein